MIFIDSKTVFGVRLQTYNTHPFWIQNDLNNEFECSVCLYKSDKKECVCPQCESVMDNDIDAHKVTIPNWYCPKCYAFKFNKGSCDICNAQMENIYERLIGGEK